MALTRRRGRSYGQSQADIPAEILRYSALNGYPARHFTDAVCACGARVFSLRLDEAAGAAVRRCAACKEEHPMGDSAEFLADAELEECACSCGRDQLEITAGVSLYDGGDDVRWLYLGCRCTACGRVAVYGDWKNEFSGYAAYLSRV